MAMTGEDKIRGAYFEMAVFEALASGNTLTYIVHGGQDQTTEKPLKRLETQFISKKSAEEVDIEENTCYHCPEMKGVDIILKVTHKVYFIQCSVAQFDKLLSKSCFWESAKSGWVPILITPDPELDVKITAKKTSQLAKQYNSGKFHVAKVLSLLTKDDVSMFGNI